MKDPVTAADGVCYERSAIERWFKQGNDTSPSTRVILASMTLYPAVNLRQIMQGIIDGMDADESAEKAASTSRGKRKRCERSITNASV